MQDDSYSAAVDGEVPKYPYGQVPKHPCIWHKNCGNYLHSSMCSAIELEGEMFEDKEKWLCITCHDSTRSKNNNKKKKKKRTTKKRKHKAGETSQQHDEDFAAAFGDVRTGNVTDSAAATISNTLPPVESSISKKQKNKKPKTKDRHQSNLRRFMDHTHGRTEASKNLFEKEHVWTQDEMFAITPDQIVRHLKVRAYNNPDADIETARPTFCRWETQPPGSRFQKVSSQARTFA